MGRGGGGARPGDRSEGRDKQRVFPCRSIAFAATDLSDAQKLLYGRLAVTKREEATNANFVALTEQGELIGPELDRGRLRAARDNRTYSLRRELWQDVVMEWQFPRPAFTRIVASLPLGVCVLGRTHAHTPKVSNELTQSR
jgi:hypothetical protein